jgi:hypothetical protein
MDWSTVGSCPKEQSVHLKTRRQLLTLNEVSGFSLSLPVYSYTSYMRICNMYASDDSAT